MHSVDALFQTSQLYCKGNSRIVPILDDLVSRLKPHLKGKGKLFQCGAGPMGWTIEVALFRDDAFPMLVQQLRRVLTEMQLKDEVNCHRVRWQDGRLNTLQEVTFRT